MATAGTALLVDRLSKVYADGTRALEELELQIAAGCFFGLLGPNGAGKTTLIGAVAALLRRLARGQMAVRHPTAGSFGVHAEIYQGSWAGYTVRWSYWLAQTIAIGEEVDAGYQHVGGYHKLHARRRAQQRGIITHSEHRARRDAGEITADQVGF